jgi:hypothetical protein
MADPTKHEPEKIASQLPPLGAATNEATRRFGAMRGQIEIDARFIDALPEDELNCWAV